MNLEWTWKERAVVECEGLPRHFPGGTKENNEKFIQSTRVLAEVGVKGFQYTKQKYYSCGCVVG
jgi:hypothetical protein